MDVSRDLEKELSRVRQELMACFRETLPSKQFSAEIFLATVSLHLIAAEVQQTQNIEKRRRLLNETDQQKSTIQKGIQLLRQAKPRRERRVHSAQQRVLS